MINNPPNIQVSAEVVPFTQCSNRSTEIAADSTVEIVDANPKRIYAVFINNSAFPLTLILGARNDGTLDKGIPLNPSGSFEITTANLYRGKVSVISSKSVKISWIECEE